MSARSEADQLHQARAILHLQEDADRDAVLAAIAEMRAQGERLISGSRPSIQMSLREALDECQADYLEECEFGWAYEAWRDDYYGV